MIMHNGVILGKIGFQQLDDQSFYKCLQFQTCVYKKNLNGLKFRVVYVHLFLCVYCICFGSDKQL